jgi:ERCC4-related helicase
MAEEGTNSIDGEKYDLRSYQTEMVEASLRQNIIVAVILKNRL